MNTATTVITCCAATLLWHSLHASPPDNPPPEDVRAAIRRVEHQLEVERQRLDRLYRVLGPHLEELEKEAADMAKQAAEDKALAMPEVARVADEELTALGCVNPAAAQFAVITRGGAIRVFDANGKVAKELRQPGQNCTCLAFSPNGRELLAGTGAGALLVWDMATDECTTLTTEPGRKVDRVCWLGNDRVVWGSNMTYWADDGKPSNHDQPAGAVLGRENARRQWTFRGFVRNDFVTLAGSVDGRLLCVLEIPGLPRGGFLLDGATGEVLHTCYDDDHGCGPLSAGISPDGGTFAIGYAPYDIILWDARTGQKRKLLEGHSNWVVSLAFSADSRRCVSGAGDSTARVWDIERFKEIGRIRFDGLSSYVDSVGLSPKGDLVFALVEGLLVISQVGPASGN